MLEIQVAITSARLATSSKLQSVSPFETEIHIKHWYTTALWLSPGCSKEFRDHQKPTQRKPTRTKGRLLEIYSACNAAEHPRAYFRTPSRAVAASLTWRDQQKLAGWQTTPL